MGDKEDVNLLEIDRGLVTAPAGCGKTELIARALARHKGPKPILVLTHTNAGVAALRGRLNRAGVPSKSYRLATIDGWAIRLISTFPLRSGHSPKLLELLKPAKDYPEIRITTANLLQSCCISEILSSSYERLIVDEYQDCSTLQHSIVVNAAAVLPTVVLGDDLQAIFNFGSDKLADWETETCKEFPEVGTLKTPWRWINARAEELGRWLLDVRKRLRNGEAIDLKHAPSNVVLHLLDGSNDHKIRLEAARVQPPGKNESVVIIGESTSRKSQQLIASQTPGAITVEAVDFKDLIEFAHSFDLRDGNAVSDLAQFGQSLMTNVGAEHLIKRITSHRDKTSRTPPTELEQSALRFVASPSHASALDVLVEMNKQPGVRVHRPEILSAAIKAFKECGNHGQLSLYDAAIRMRERNRMTGRRLGRRTVGSTLLVKGLEAEVSVVLHACELDARNLYVAMTRGSKLLILCSKNAVLKPK
jgi:DNA helicase-2/ATP-dependent DNA helicase PcrA